MSRSYKKTPRAGNDKSSNGYKTIFNRKLRRKMNQHEDFELSSKGGFKKENPSWDISDYQSINYTFEEYYTLMMRMWEKYESDRKPAPTKKELYRAWYKDYKMK